jgi:hypothetical protein
MNYKIYTNDVGPNGYSCYGSIESKSGHSALAKAARMVRRFAPVKVLAVPESRFDEAFVKGSGISPTGLRLRRGTFEAWGALLGDRVSFFGRPERCQNGIVIHGPHCNKE